MRTVQILAWVQGFLQMQCSAGAEGTETDRRAQNLYRVCVWHSHTNHHQMHVCSGTCLALSEPNGTKLPVVVIQSHSRTICLSDLSLCVRVCCRVCVCVCVCVYRIWAYLPRVLGLSI